MPHLSGFQVTGTNVYSADGAQEVDIVVRNRGHDEELRWLGDDVLVECKNWSRPVDSGEVAWFAWKLKRGNARAGILVAAEGITGRPERREDAFAVAYHTNAFDKLQILLVTLEDLTALTVTDDLKELLIRRSSALAAVADPFTFGI